MNWQAQRTDTGTVHIIPRNDLVAHDADSEDCVCGPMIEPVQRDDGSYGWLIVHQSLDGREAREESYE